MVPQAFSYKQQQQPNTNPSSQGGGITPQSVAGFRPPAPSTNSTSNPYAVPSSTSAAKVPTYQNNYGDPNQLGSVSGINQVLGQYNEQGQLDPLINLLKSLGVYSYPLAGQQMQFAGQLEPQRQSAIQGYLNYASPASQQAQVNTYGNQALQNAMQGATASNAAQRAAGLGTGYQAGNLALAGEAAANAKNQYQAQINSPQYQQQLLQGILGAIGQGQSSPALQTLLGINPQLLQQEQTTLQNQQQAGGGPLGGLFGNLLGSGGLGGLLSGLGIGGGGGGGLSMPFGVGGASPGVFF